MKSKFFLISTVLLMGFLMYSCKPSDGKIQQEVTAKLTAAQLPVTAGVSSGVVTLSGVVTDDASKASAEKMAMEVKDVRSVLNNIMVKVPEPVPSPDELLKAKIDSTFQAAGFKEIMATVKNGEIILDGTVKKADLKKVLEIANNSKPQKVTNNLKTK